MNLETRKLSQIWLNYHSLSRTYSQVIFIKSSQTHHGRRYCEQSCCLLGRIIVRNNSSCIPIHQPGHVGSWVSVLHRNCMNLEKRKLSQIWLKYHSLSRTYNQVIFIKSSWTHHGRRYCEQSCCLLGLGRIMVGNHSWHLMVSLVLETEIISLTSFRYDDAIFLTNNEI